MTQRSRVRFAAESFRVRHTSFSQFLPLGFYSDNKIMIVKVVTALTAALKIIEGTVPRCCHPRLWLSWFNYLP